jgi:aspartyl/asparaginyl-tRNA synthetase
MEDRVISFSRINRYIKRVLLVSMVGIFLMGCATMFATPIKKILDNPRDYSGKTVTIAGKVTEVAGLVFVQYFVVKDDTGEITVVTQRPLPREGSKITVKGRVQQAFSIGDKQFIVIVENKEN